MYPKTFAALCLLLLLALAASFALSSESVHVAGAKDARANFRLENAVSESLSVEVADSYHGGYELRIVNISGRDIATVYVSLIRGDEALRGILAPAAHIVSRLGHIEPRLLATGEATSSIFHADEYVSVVRVEGVLFGDGDVSGEGWPRESLEIDREAAKQASRLVAHIAAESPGLQAFRRRIAPEIDQTRNDAYYGIVSSAARIAEVEGESRYGLTRARLAAAAKANERRFTR